MQILNINNSSDDDPFMPFHQGYVYHQQNVTISYTSYTQINLLEKSCNLSFSLLTDMSRRRHLKVNTVLLKEKAIPTLAEIPK